MSAHHPGGTVVPTPHSGPPRNSISLGMGSLTLRYKAEDQWHGEVLATVASEGFGGTASAWFKKADISSFADRMSEYPLNEPPLSMASGYLSPWSGLERHLSVAILPHDLRGNLRVVIELAPPPRGEDDLGTYSTVRTWFAVTYTDLERFQCALRRMLKDEAEEAILTDGG